MVSLSKACTELHLDVIIINRDMNFKIHNINLPLKDQVLKDKKGQMGEDFIRQGCREAEAKLEEGLYPLLIIILIIH